MLTARTEYKFIFDGIDNVFQLPAEIVNIESPLYVNTTPIFLEDFDYNVDDKTVTISSDILFENDVVKIFAYLNSDGTIKPNIEVLKKISYDNIDQFNEDINHNFGILQNSPLFRGIPGQEGIPGTDGLRGVRGIKFIFVDLLSFQQQFPNELTVASEIDLDFLNSKVSSFQNKQKLLVALGVEELIDKDIVVLQNSLMLSFNFINQLFVDSGLAFNPETNLLSNINKTIENYVSQYVNNHPALNNIQNNFAQYQTYAKNFADNNSGFITNELLASSVFSPYIQNFNNAVGIHLPNHKYFGYADNVTAIGNSHTSVFGSMRRYYQLLMATISVAGTETLSSDYAPGANNIPSAVFLQDTYNNGIYIGHKDKPNLKRFASIFKNEANDLVIKSDSSKLPSEYSELRLNRQYMKFDKLVQFGDSLEVSRDLSVFSDINQKHFKTGKFTQGANAGNTHNNHKAEIGSRENGTITLNLSEFQEFDRYRNRVFVTDSIGRVSKDYAIESSVPLQDDLRGINLLTTTIGNKYNVLTSQYFAYLATKLNNVSSYISANFWRKDQFDSGEIPSLSLNRDLHVERNSNFADLLVVNKSLNKVVVGASKFDINSDDIALSKFKNKVLVTDANGLMSKSYEILLEDSGIIPELSNPQHKILTAKHWNKLFTMITNSAEVITTNVWKKDQYETNEIPGIHLQKLLKVGNETTQVTDIVFRNSSGLLFSITKSQNVATSNVKIGDESNSNISLEIATNTVKLTKFTNNVLVTDNNGNVLKSFFIFNGLITNTITNIGNAGGTYQDWVITNPTEPTNAQTNGIPTYRNIKQIWDFFNWMKTWIYSTFWRKTQFNTAEIPAIHVANSLKANGDVKFGSQTNPNFETSGDDTIVGKIAENATQPKTIFRFNNMRFLGRTNKVIVTNNQGDVINHELTSNEPTSGNPQSTDANIDIRVLENFWKKEIANQTFENVPDSADITTTSKLFRWTVANLKAIRTLIYNRPTFQDMDDMLPVGSIILKSNYGVIKPGWYAMNGQRIIIHEQPINRIVVLPNLTDKYLRFNTTPNTIGGNLWKVLGEANIPPHRHKFTDDVNNPNATVRVNNGIIPTTTGDIGSQNISGSGSGAGRAYWTSNYGGINNGTSVEPIKIEPEFFTLIPLIKLHNASVPGNVWNPGPVFPTP